LRHPAVLAVGITAVPDAIRGHEVMACIVPRKPLEKTFESAAHDVVSFCLRQLAYYKAPGYVAFCDQLPLTATEKIQRAALNTLARELLEQGKCIDTRSLKRRDSSAAEARIPEQASGT
jgi:acyl-coenzyme A synthetase/AMP-(fatty) acid ligase